MYHRQTGRRHSKKTSRTVVETSNDGSYTIAIDRIKHRSFSETQFSQFAQQVFNVAQRVTAHRRRPHNRSIGALLVDEIPRELWDQLRIRAEHDAAAHGLGVARVHDVVQRLLTCYASVGLEPIESLEDRPLPPDFSL